MERPDLDLTVRETVLLVVDAAGGVDVGRTAVQKLCYFAGVRLNEDLGHRPHYYGPYSREVEDALLNESFAGDLEETMRTFTGGSGRTGRSYSYRLTDQGAELVAELRRDKAQAAERVRDIVGRLGELVPGYRQHRLSVAAKVDLILRQRGGGATTDDIPELARQLGWTVSDEEVDRAVDILVALGRVETSAA